MFFFRFVLAVLVAFPALAATFGTVVPLLGGAADLVIDDARGRLYLVNTNSSRVEFYSIAQRRFLNPVRTDLHPLSAALSRSGKLLYVTCHDQASLNVIDLDTAAVVKRINLPAKPEGVAVGNDERVLITTIGTGQGNIVNNLILYDPRADLGKDILAIPVTIPAPGSPVTPPAGRPAYATRSMLETTRDGRFVVGVNNVGTTRIVFVYEVASATVLRSRVVAGVSNVISISPDGEKFMAGLTLFETSTLTVLAQQNASNAPFSFPGGAANNFSTQQNQGGSVFSVDGSVIYSAFNIAPVQNPPARPNVSRLLLNDPDNLLITLGLQLPENLAGKIAISGDGNTLFALSESGFVILPANTIFQSPIAVPESTVALLATDQCGVTGAQRAAAVGVTNIGRGRLTASAQLLMLPPTGNPGLGGFGGPGGGGPGGGVIIILPPVAGGGGGFPVGGAGAAGGIAAQQSVQANSPTVQTQNTPAGSMINFRFNPAAARTQGTVPPHNFLIQSSEAINIPPNVKVFQNFRDSEARSNLIPIPVNAADNEGLFDMLIDDQRQRLYIANSGLNRVEVFDLRTRRLLAPIKVGQLPHSMAFDIDGARLYVGNSGSETISVVDLDRGRQIGLVRFPPLPFNANVALATPNVLASSQRGAHVIVSAGTNNSTLWRILGNEVVPKPLASPVFGGARVLPGPNQTMVSTPGGEYTMLLAGNGNVYLYDSSVDEWVAGRQLFGPANNPTLAPIQGYFGPVAAGPRGQYYIANGLVLNSALTPVAGNPSIPVPGPVPGGGIPGRAPATTSRPIAAVAPAGNTSFLRFSQPVQAAGNAAALAAAPADLPTVEVVDVNSGATMRSAPALEPPLARVVGNQTQRVTGRTMAFDQQNNMAYVLTTSGLSVVPMQPVQPAERPVIAANGIVSTANYSTTLAPGSLAAVFGRSLASTASSPGAPLPTTLGGACVTLNNQPLPLFSTAEGQINAQIPPELAAGRYSLVVRNLDRQAGSVATPVTLVKFAPAVFAGDNGQAAIYHANGSLVTPDRPASRDERLIMYATGLGVTKGGPVVSGQPSPSNPLAVTQKVQVYFGDPRYKEAEIIVEWSGLVPGFVGLYQVNLYVPGAHIKGKALPVTVKVGGASTPAKAPVMPVTSVD